MRILREIKLFRFYPVIFLALWFSACSKEDVTSTGTITPGDPDPYVAAFLAELNTDTIKATVQKLQDYTTRFFLAGNRRQIACDIRNQFIRYGYPDTRLDSFSVSAEWNGSQYTTWQYNVIASLTGSSSSGTYVAGAHYDCIAEDGDPFQIAPGADDNASGTAGILEIARVMKKRAFSPKNTIEFIAFACEENELDGSDDYAKKAKAAGRNIIMMLNNDMIAYDPRDPAGWTINVMDYTNSEDLWQQLVRCGKTYTSLKFINNNVYNQEGDSYSFFLHGYKALFMNSDAEDSYYHTRDDILSHYNWDYCRVVVSLSCALLVQENKP